MISSNYSEVYSWFEKSGIISNIRTHLRQNLVNALKINVTHARDDDTTDLRSAKQYVYDMLIAEYLLNYNYAYTLSVFSSEAPLLMNFHKHAKISASKTGDNKNIKQNKLPNDYVCHILQTLGINPKNLNGKNILSQYHVSEEPLILSVVKYLTSNLSNKLSEDDNNREKSNNRSHCIMSQETQTDHIESKEHGESIVLSQAKDKLYRQKELFSKQLKNKEFQLKEKALLIEKQLILLNEKLHHAQNLMRIVDTKETNIANERLKIEKFLSSRESELSIKEKLVDQESDRLQKERDSYKTFEIDMKKLKEELSKLRNELGNDDRGIMNSNKMRQQDFCVQTDVIYDFKRSIEEVRLLNEENKELSSLIKEQQSRIEELTLRSITLARQLEEAQLKINSSNNVTLKHNNVNVNTIFSESSSTEDILQDAKMRLKRLEEESLRADQYYYNCITTSP